MTSQGAHPGAGRWIRQPRAEDSASIVRIVNDRTMRDVGMASYTERDVAKMLSAPAATEKYRILGLGARAAAWLEVDAGDDFYEGFVETAHEGKGLGTMLAAEAEEMLRAAGRTKAVVNVGSEAGCRFFERLGYRFVHGEHAMVYDLSRDPVGLEVPPDIDVSPFREGTDEETFYEVMKDGFGSDWPNAGAEYAEWIARQEGDNYDPALWFVARRAGVPVGVLEGRPRWGAQDDHGWIKNIAVLPDHRRGGVGRALLFAAFAAFHDRGKRWVVLGVDADNPTKAPDFYLRVGMQVRGHSWDYEKELAPR